MSRFGQFTRKKKILTVILVIIGIIVGLSLSSMIIINSQQNKVTSIQEERLTKLSFTVAELKDDITYIKEVYKRVHPEPIDSFPIVDITDQLNSLLNTIDSDMYRLDFYKLVAPIISQVNDEHVELSFPLSDFNKLILDGRKVFPLDIQILNGSIYTSDEYDGIKSGIQILSINGVESNKLVDKLGGYFSGTRDEQKQFYLQNQFREILSLIYDFDDTFDLKLNDTISNTVSDSKINGIIYKKSEIPLFSYKVVDDKMIFTYHEFEDPDYKFETFLEEMFTKIRDDDIKELIIDIRDNRGGGSYFGDLIFDYLYNEEFNQILSAEVLVSQEIRDDFIGNVPSFMRWFPFQYTHPMLKPLWTTDIGETSNFEFPNYVPSDNPLRFEGDTTLFLGPGVMSSASLFAGTFDFLGIGKTIGTPTGGYPTLYGNVIELFLPNTGLILKLPTTVISGHGVGPIIPDIAVYQTVLDLQKGIDTILDYNS